MLTIGFILMLIFPACAGEAATLAIAGMELAAVAIGTGASVMSDKQRRNAGICEWWGTGPFCDGACPPNAIEFNRANNWKLTHPVTGETHDDPSFGRSCWWGWHGKAFCCSLDRHDPYWHGMYANLINNKFSCNTFRGGVHRSLIDPLEPKLICGMLRCKDLTSDSMVAELVEIQGLMCDTVHMKGWLGVNHGGIILWTSSASNYTMVVDKWMKISS